MEIQRQEIFGMRCYILHKVTVDWSIPFKHAVFEVAPRTFEQDKVFSLEGSSNPEKKSGVEVVDIYLWGFPTERGDIWEANQAFEFVKQNRLKLAGPRELFAIGKQYPSAYNKSGQYLLIIGLPLIPDQTIMPVVRCGESFSIDSHQVAGDVNKLRFGRYLFATVGAPDTAPA